MSTQQTISWRAGQGRHGVATTPVSFGAVLAARRAALRLSLRALAAETELDVGQLSRIERSVLPPPQQERVLMRLAKALHLDTAEEVSEFCDLSAAENGRIPAALLASRPVARALPLVLRALRLLAQDADIDRRAMEPTVPRAHTDLARMATRLDAHGLDVHVADPHDDDAQVAQHLHRAIATAADATREPHARDALRDAIALASGVDLHRRTLPRSGAAAHDSATPDAQPLYAARLAEDAAHLQHTFNDAVLAAPTLAMLMDRVSAAGAHGVVFGGWARDTVASRMFHRVIAPADIDLVVDGLSTADLGALLEACAPGGVTRNVFDGFTVRAGAWKADIWTLESTYTFRVRGTIPSFALLPTTTVFTVESIVFKPAQWWGTPSVLEAGFYDSLDRGVIDLQTGEHPFPIFQAGRALQYAEKLSLQLSPSVLQLLSAAVTDDDAFLHAKAGVRQYASPLFRTDVLRDLASLKVAFARFTPPSVDAPHLARNPSAP